MQSIISTILSILLLLTSLPLALSVAVVTVPELFDGHILGEMRFAGTFNGLDGVTVDKTGTMNEILVQVQTDHPNWKPNFTVPHRHGPPSDDASISARDNAVEAGEQRKEAMFCWPLADHPEMQRANSDDVSKIIRLLVDVNGVAYAGPHQCVRFACIGDATSYLCNERSTVMSIPTQVLATYVGDIKYLCLSGWNGQRGLVCGKQTDTDGFYVIVTQQAGGC